VGGEEGGRCLCKSGFVPSDGGSAGVDSDVDCEAIVYQRCSGKYAHDSNGICSDEDSCESVCGSVENVAAFDTNLGICTCDDTITAKEVCDSTCLATRETLSFTAAGDIILEYPDNDSEDATQTFNRDAFPQLIG
jgi:hypothetical protein